MNKLYKFHASFGRMGDLSGIFVEDEDRVAGLMGKTVYLGEVLGKHSEVECTIDQKIIVALTDDQAFIDKFMVLKCESGTNPFNYLDE